MEPLELSPPQLLEAQVAVVATLGKLVATVTAPRRRLWPLLYPESLHAALRKFIWTLRDTLDHGDITSLRQRGVTPLGQAMATLRATPGATRDNVTAAVRAWQGAVAALDKSWGRLGGEVLELQVNWEIAAIDKDTDKDTDEDTDTDTDEDTDTDTNEDIPVAVATATSPAGDLRDETTGWGTAGNSLVAATLQLAVFLSLMMDVSQARLLRAFEAMEEPTSQAGAATKRRQQAEEARRRLYHLVVTCQRARMLPFELLGRLCYIEAALGETQEAFADVPEALVAAVAEFELLWEASARLTTRHLLVTLGEIDFLLSSPHGSSGGPGGPRGRVVAERCQKAIEDIPRLLEDMDVTAVTSPRC